MGELAKPNANYQDASSEDNAKQRTSRYCYLASAWKLQ